MKFFFPIVALAFVSTPAFATSPVSVLSNPALQALVKLATDKHHGQCRAPRESDIRWRCMGAIMPTKEPRIDANGCGFLVEVQCQGEVMRIQGSTRYFFLNTPRPNKVKPTGSIVTVDSVTFGNE